MRSVLLVHGLTSSARVWWRVASELADRGWAVTAVDLRGHGAAPPGTSYSVDDLAGDLLGTGRPWQVAVGHSIGGAAVLAAGMSTGWAHRLVLVDPVITVDPAERDDFEAALLDELTATEESLSAAHPDWHDDDVFWKVWSARQCSPNVVRRVTADTNPLDMSAELAQAPVPVTLLAADRHLGGIVDIEAVRAIARENPRLHVELVERTGHSIFRQRPEVVVAAVER